MRALTHLLFAGGALFGMQGCLPDFSPDPINHELDETLADSGTPAGDASRPAEAGAKDATVVVPPRDAATADAKTTDAKTTDPVATTDGGDDMPVGEPDGGDDMEPEPTGPCNFAGRYAITERFGMDGLGAKQIVQNWYYVELVQSGTELTFTNSFGCGAQVNGVGLIQVKMDDTKAWPAYANNPAYLGRKGTVEQVADGCAMHFDKDATVRGATVEKYRDVNVALPTLEQKATADAPGWEDWDNDNNPGVTLNISGVAQGALYAVLRNWTEYTGTVQEGATTLRMALNWGQKRSTLGYMGSSLLTADATRDTDESKHIVELGKMTEEQTTGDHEAICKNVRDLAPTITPNANKI